MRLGAIDMAAANLFGSILFNITLLAFDDLLYVRGPLASTVSPTGSSAPSYRRPDRPASIEATMWSASRSTDANVA